VTLINEDKTRITRGRGKRTRQHKDHVSANKTWVCYDPASRLEKKMTRIMTQDIYFNNKKLLHTLILTSPISAFCFISPDSFATH